MKAAELFVKYAESFGAIGCRIESAGELAPALRTALNSNQLTIIDCPVDASENLRLTERLGALVVTTAPEPVLMPAALNAARSLGSPVPQSNQPTNVVEELAT